MKSFIEDYYKDYKKFLEPFTFQINTKDETIDIRFSKEHFSHLVGLQYIYPDTPSSVHTNNLETGNIRIYENNKILKNKSYMKCKYKMLHFQKTFNIFDKCELFFFKSRCNINNITMDYMLSSKINNIEINIGFVKDRLNNYYSPTSFLVNANPSYHGKFKTKGDFIQIISIDKINNLTNETKAIHIKGNMPENIKYDLKKYNFDAPDFIIEAIQNYNNEKGKFCSLPQIATDYKYDKNKKIKNPLLQSIGKYFETFQENERKCVKSEIASTKLKHKSIEIELE